MNWKKIISLVRSECEDHEEELLLKNKSREILPFNKKLTTNNYTVNFSGRLKFWKREK